MTSSVRGPGSVGPLNYFDWRPRNEAGGWRTAEELILIQILVIIIFLILKVRPAGLDLVHHHAAGWRHVRGHFIIILLVPFQKCLRSPDVILVTHVEAGEVDQLVD